MTKQIPGQMSLFDIIEQPKTRKKCGSCAHFHEVVSGPGDIYHGTACLKDRPWAHFKEPEDPVCEYYEIREEAIDG